MVCVINTETELCIFKLFLLFCFLSGVVSATSISKADENQKEVDSPPTSSREELESASPAESCSESEISDFSILNWTWRAWIVKANLRRISNKLSAKSVEEPEFEEVSSQEVFIGMDTVSLASHVRDSISEPVEVQTPSNPDAFEQGLKNGADDDPVKLNTSTGMTHKDTTDDNGFNPESNQEDNESLPNKRKPKKVSEGGNSGDVETTKRRRRKYKMKGITSKRRKLNDDEKSPISSTDDISFKSSGSERKAEEGNLQEVKRLRLRGPREKKSSLHSLSIRESENALNGESISEGNIRKNNKQAIQTLVKDISSTERESFHGANQTVDHERPGVKHTIDISQHAVLASQAKLDAFIEVMATNAARSSSETLRNKPGRSEHSKPTSRSSVSVIVHRNSDNVEISPDFYKHATLSKSCFDLRHDAQNYSTRSVCTRNDVAASQSEYEQENPNTHDVMERNTQCVPIHEQQQNHMSNESLSFYDVGCRENLPLKSKIPPQQQKYLSGTSLSRIISGNSAINDSTKASRTVASSCSQIYYEPEELVIARDIAGISGHKEHLNGNQGGMLL